MEFVIVIAASCSASLLTFFSGFGLGTIMTPVFMLFFPIEVAIAMTAIVHFANNIFKLGLIGKNIDYTTLLKFGLPAIIGGLGGAYSLSLLGDSTSVISYSIGSTTLETKTEYILIAGVMTFSSLFDLIPRLKKLEFPSSMLIPGGVLSGFFGGLSGHQGALRSAFLIKAGLTKEQFIATGVSVACLVDTARISVYIKEGNLTSAIDNKWLLISATLSAFLGAFFGKRILKKITIDSIQLIVGILIIILAIGLALGLF